MMEFPSAVALFLTMLDRNDVAVDHATAFLVHDGDQRWLITNHHVVTSDKVETHPRDWPRSLRVGFRLAGAIPQTFVGETVDRAIPLYDEAGEPIWLVHPDLRERVDVVAVPVPSDGHLDGFAYDLTAPAPGLLVAVGRPVHVVGFPFGFSSTHQTAIWATGFIASEPEGDYNDLPRFLVDARTRPGQSGSPVIIYSAVGDLPMEDGGRSPSGSAIQQLLGVYSGRIHQEADLGIVWRRVVIDEIVGGGVRHGDYS